MLLFNAFTKLQAGLLSAFTALTMAVEPAAPPVEELEEIVLPEEGDAADPGLEFTDEGDPTARREWRCYDDDDREWRGHCLVRCDDDDGHFGDNDDDDDYRAVTGKIRIRGNRDLCRRRARNYCKRRGDRVDDWCFGDRKWDNDDHDRDDNDHRD
jgi:hypothetical protein